MAPRPDRFLVGMLIALASAGCFTPTNMAGVGGSDAGRPRDAGTCVRSCAGKLCGSDGCGGVCGTCPTGWPCNSAGQCEVPNKCPGFVCNAGETCDPADLVCKDPRQNYCVIR